MKDFTHFDKLEDLDTESVYLVHRAREATEFAYAPYSRFLVGSALMLEDDIIVSGANQENASFPLCMCAERVALYSAAMLHPGKKIKKLAVTAMRKGHKELLAGACCGACRQVMVEFEKKQGAAFEVVMLGEDGKWIKCKSAAALIPFGFNLSV